MTIRLKGPWYSVRCLGPHQLPAAATRGSWIQLGRAAAGMDGWWRYTTDLRVFVGDTSEVAGARRARHVRPVALVAMFLRAVVPPSRVLVSVAFRSSTFGISTGYHILDQMVWVNHPYALDSGIRSVELCGGTPWRGRLLALGIVRLSYRVSEGGCSRWIPLGRLIAVASTMAG